MIVLAAGLGLRAGRTSAGRPLSRGRSLSLRRARRPVALALDAEPGVAFDRVSPEAAAALPRKWVVFSDLHVRQDTLPVCLSLLRRVAAEARAREAGVLCLGDFWHTGSVISTRQLNLVLEEIGSWGDATPVLMIPGNHDQARSAREAPPSTPRPQLRLSVARAGRRRATCRRALAAPTPPPPLAS